MEYPWSSSGADSTGKGKQMENLEIMYFEELLTCTDFSLMQNEAHDKSKNSMKNRRI